MLIFRTFLYPFISLRRAESTNTLYEIRPLGYIGRQFARAQHKPLAVLRHPVGWGDDIVFVLSQAGSDVGGNFQLGDEA